jgi:hypothetical protein
MVLAPLKQSKHGMSLKLYKEINTKNKRGDGWGWDK